MARFPSPRHAVRRRPRLPHHRAGCPSPLSPRLAPIPRETCPARRLQTPGRRSVRNATSGSPSRPSVSGSRASSPEPCRAARVASSGMRCVICDTVRVSITFSPCGMPDIWRLEEKPPRGRVSIPRQNGGWPRGPLFYRVFGIVYPASRSTYLTIAVRSSCAAPWCMACLNTRRAA